MEIVHPMPLRAVIRCKAKQHLLSIAGGDPSPINEPLLDEIAATMFNCDRYQTLYYQCSSQEQATAIADQIAGDIVAEYQQIIQQQDDPLVQQLNALL